LIFCKFHQVLNWFIFTQHKQYKHGTQPIITVTKVTAKQSITDQIHLSNNSWSKSKCLGVTLGSAWALSINNDPISECKEWTSAWVAVRILELPPWTAPLLLVAPSKCHKRGNTCSTTCFCLREYTDLTKSTKKEKHFLLISNNQGFHVYHSLGKCWLQFDFLKICS
jgi:hypothetical protein